MLNPDIPEGSFVRGLTGSFIYAVTDLILLRHRRSDLDARNISDILERLCKNLVDQDLDEVLIPGPRPGGLTKRRLGLDLWFGLLTGSPDVPSLVFAL
ncbi:unnamed protein product [Symbiodinium necroappetens]|nr:unnamed protein product [Symbiodinium sp. KB8]CAE7411192.1 unnamed protein product [Symbiodinium necroappetens]CAE7758980.1 unnamed protein product [Symbiodinium microadriaticum]